MLYKCWLMLVPWEYRIIIFTLRRRYPWQNCSFIAKELFFLQKLAARLSYKYKLEQVNLFFPLLSFSPSPFFSSYLSFLIPSSSLASPPPPKTITWMSQSQLPPSRLSSPSRKLLVQDPLAYLGSLRVLFLYSWLGVGESLVLLLVSLIFFLHRAIFSRMGLMYRYQTRLSNPMTRNRL